MDYGSSIELAKRSTGDRHFDGAIENVPKALLLDPSYATAIKNLDRSIIWGWKQAKGIILEEKKEDVNTP